MNRLDTVKSLMVNDAVVYTQVDEDIVLMSPNNGEYHGLNAVGALIWKLLESSAMTFQELVNYITDHYEIDADVAATDVLNFLEEMIQKDFVKQAD